MKILKYIIIVILAYIVISLTIARGLVIYAENNEVLIEKYINKSLGINININNIQGNWKGLYPSIKINIKKDPAAKSKAYSFPELVYIDFNIYKSILIFKPVIKKLYAENATYKDNYKNFISLLNFKNKKNYVVLESLELAKSNIIIAKGRNLFNFENLKLIAIKNNIKIRANIDNNKTLSADFKNIMFDGKSLKSIDYKIISEGTFNYEFKNIFEGYDLDVKNNNLSILISGNYKNNNFISQVSLVTSRKSHIKVNGSTFNNIDIKALFRGNLQKKIDFELIKATFSTQNSNNYNLSSLAGIYNFSTNNVSLYGDDLNIDTKMISEDFALFKKTDFYFSGNARNIELKVNLKDFGDNFYISGDFNKSTILYKKNYISNFSGSIKTNLDTVFINFKSTNAAIRYRNILRKDSFFNSINGNIEISNLSSPLINISNLSFDNNEIKIDFNGFIDYKNDRVKLISHIDRLNMKYATDYMPLTLIKKKSSLWFKKAFKSGKASNSNILLSGKVSRYPFFDDLSGISFAVFQITGLNVEYKNGWVPLEKISGYAYFNKKNAYFYPQDFKVLDTTVSNSKLEIKNVQDAEIDISGELTGPIDNLFEYSNSGSITDINRENLSNLNGVTKTDFQIKIPLKGKKIKLRSDIKLENVSFNFNAEGGISNINGYLYYKNEKFFTELNNPLIAIFNSNDISMNLDTLNNGDFVLSGTQKIKNKNFFSIPIFKNRILGNSNWDYKINVPGFRSKTKVIHVEAKSNLNGTTISFPRPFKKENNINSSALIKADYSDKEFHNISILYNNIRAEIKSLKSLNGYINFSGDRIKIPDSRIDLLGKISKFDINEWKLISENSKSIDYLQYLNKINVDFNELIFRDIRLKNLSINGFNSKKYFIFNDISVNTNEVNIIANGKIEFNNMSTFNININSSNVENLLNYWNYKHSLRDSSVSSDFNINWQGHLLDFELNKVYGKFSVNMKDGRLKNVGNRASRIFGLFNIDLLSKRLALDFDDVTKNGFYFNTLGGDFRIDSGDIFTTNLLVKGPSAEILAVGTTNIINETYDMRVVASPEFGEALPVIALLGGPITAAATFAAEKLAKAFGKDINNLVKVKYTVTGPWSNPMINVVNKNNNALDGIEDLFK